MNAASAYALIGALSVFGGLFLSDHYLHSALLAFGSFAYCAAICVTIEDLK